jgi:hypothetical protein
MVRKQVYIERRHEQMLKERARQYRVTEADLIRRAIDRGLEGAPSSIPDPEAWKAFKRRTAPRKGESTRKVRRWTRDELHAR